MFEMIIITVIKVAGESERKSLFLLPNKIYHYVYSSYCIASLKQNLQGKLSRIHLKS